MSISSKGDFGLTSEQLRRKYTPEHSSYGREDWRLETSAGDTCLGYWEWVLHNVESSYYDPCDNCEKEECDKTFVPDWGFVCEECSSVV